MQTFEKGEMDANQEVQTAARLRGADIDFSSVVWSGWAAFTFHT